MFKLWRKSGSNGENSSRITSDYGLSELLLAHLRLSDLCPDCVKTILF